MNDNCLLCGSLIRKLRNPIVCRTPMGMVVAPCNADWHRVELHTLTLVMSEGSEPVLTVSPVGTVTFDAEKFYRAIADMQQAAWIAGNKAWQSGDHFDDASLRGPSASAGTTPTLAELRKLAKAFGAAVAAHSHSLHTDNDQAGAMQRSVDAQAALDAALVRLTPSGATAGGEDTKRLDWMLRDAKMAMVEDGDELGLWLTDREDERAFAILADCSGDSDEEPLTAEDAPFLTDEQRAHLNGTIPKARGFVNDPAALRAAIDQEISASASRERPSK